MARDAALDFALAASPCGGLLCSRSARLAPQFLRDSDGGLFLGASDRRLGEMT